ncbi:hypothetical protein RC26_02750 [Campylobacter jejuni]|nr:hypothetical protein RC26_02750 [Campylobacter jejuni]
MPINFLENLWNFKMLSCLYIFFIGIMFSIFIYCINEKELDLPLIISFIYIKIISISYILLMILNN